MPHRATAKAPSLRTAIAAGALLAATAALAFGARGLVAREGRPPAPKAARTGGAEAPAPAGRARRVASADAPDPREPFPPGDESLAPQDEMGPGRSDGPTPMRDDPTRGRSWQPIHRDEIGTSLPWEPGPPAQGDWREPVRRRPAPIPPGRPLPYYPPEPPPTAPPSSTVQGPPDFVGSAAGYLEIPVGQTATLFARGCRDAALRESRSATIVSREADRVLIRGLFPGRTLLDVQQESGQKTYVVQVR